MEEAEEKRRLRRRAVQQVATVFHRSFFGKVILWSVLISSVAVLLVVFDLLEAGSAADWVGGAGAIFAAAVALNIAGTDRADRQQERTVAALAQMRLVQVNAYPHMDSEYPDVQLKVGLTNYSDRPILRALLVRAEVESIAAGTFVKADPTPVQAIPVVPTVLQSQGLPQQAISAAMKNPEGVRWDPQRDETHRQKFTNGLVVTVQCIDADGEHWLLSNENDPQPNAPTSNSRLLQRLWDNRQRLANELGWISIPSQRTVKIGLAAAASPLFIYLVILNWWWIGCMFS